MADELQARLRAMEEEEREVEQSRLRLLEEHEKKTKKLQAERKRLSKMAEEEGKKEQIQEELRRQHNETRIDAEHFKGFSFTFPHDFGYGEGDEIITFLVSDKDSNRRWRPYGGHGGRKPRWYTEKLDKEKFANWHHQRILELRIYPGRIMFEHNTVKGLVSFGNELIQWSFQFAQKRISILIADRLYKETQI